MEAADQAGESIQEMTFHLFLKISVRFHMYSPRVPLCCLSPVWASTPDAWKAVFRVWELSIPLVATGEQGGFALSWFYYLMLKQPAGEIQDLMSPSLSLRESENAAAKQQELESTDPLPSFKKDCIVCYQLPMAWKLRLCCYEPLKKEKTYCVY